MRDSRVVRIKLHDAACLSTVRQHSDIDICVEDLAVWVRVQHASDGMNSAILALPGERYTVANDGQLTKLGQLVPTGQLPDGPWEPLARWLQIELPAAIFAATCPAHLPVQLVRGGQPCESQLLLTSIQSWHDYAVQAPRLRLNGLAFVMREDGQTLVRGRPLPPVPGTRYTEQEGIAAPAGWTWSPAIEATILREVLRLDAGDLAVFEQGGSWQRLRVSDFVRATRASVRASLATLPQC